jgi:hypothetical protein
MATFTEAQITDLAEIFTVNSHYMGEWLESRETMITDSDKTSILLDVTAYQAVQDDYVDILPNVANKGAKVSPDKQRSLIRGRIGALIDWQVTSGGGRLVRA